MIEEKDFNNLFNKRYYIYGVGSPSDAILAEEGMEMISKLPNLENNSNLRFFSGYEMDNDERKALINLSHIVICYGAWRDDKVCFEDYETAKSLGKKCVELISSPYQGWSMLSL